MGGGAGTGNGGGNSDEGGRDEFDDYAEELEASDIEGGASAHLWGYDHSLQIVVSIFDDC